MQCNIMQCNAMQFSAVKCNTISYIAMSYNLVNPSNTNKIKQYEKLILSLSLSLCFPFLILNNFEQVKLES
jgi:hypothetical protein